jgi:hypothetical protein
LRRDGARWIEADRRVSRGFDASELGCGGECGGLMWLLRHSGGGCLGRYVAEQHDCDDGQGEQDTRYVTSF